MNRCTMAAAVTAGCLATAAGVTVGAAPASAAPLTTRCDGQAGPVTVPGDLVVPAGRSCALNGTVILGAVRVAAGADLLLDQVRIEGPVAIRADGYLDAYESSLRGVVRAREAYGVVLDASSAGAGFSGRGAGDPYTGGFFFSQDSEIGGDLDVRDGEVYLAGSAVRGSVTSVDNTYTDVLDSTLTGDITVTNNSEGGAFCASEVDGDALYQRNAGLLQLGGDGPLADCDGVNYWGGDVAVSDNIGGVLVSGNIVRGDLSGAGNDPAPTGEDNRVRGQLAGQFVDLQPTPEDDAALEARRLTVDPQDDAAELTAKRDQRRADATARAASAGAAAL